MGDICIFMSIICTSIYLLDISLHVLKSKEATREKQNYGRDKILGLKNFKGVKIRSWDI